MGSCAAALCHEHRFYRIQSSCISVHIRMAPRCCAVAKWRRESEKNRRQRLSPQYQKAWLASFPEDLVSQPLASTDSLAR
jgi:hypothetical protein